MDNNEYYTQYISVTLKLYVSDKFELSNINHVVKSFDKLEDEDAFKEKIRDYIKKNPEVICQRKIFKDVLNDMYNAQVYISSDSKIAEKIVKYICSLNEYILNLNNYNYVVIENEGFVLKNPYKQPQQLQFTLDEIQQKIVEVINYTDEANIPNIIFTAMEYLFNVKSKRTKNFEKDKLYIYLYNYVAYLNIYLEKMKKISQKTDKYNTRKRDGNNFRRREQEITYNPKIHRQMIN